MQRDLQTTKGGRRDERRELNEMTDRRGDLLSTRESSGAAAEQ
jgi:hypothetical protein